MMSTNNILSRLTENQLLLNGTLYRNLLSSQALKSDKPKGIFQTSMKLNKPK